MGEDEFYRKYHSDLTRIEDQLRIKAEKITIRSLHHQRKYYLPVGVRVEVVRPMHNTEFCKYCNWIHITSDGKFKPYLFRLDNHVDFLTPLRRSDSTEDLESPFSGPSRGRGRTSRS